MTQQATGIEAKVCADIAARQALGVAKYGVTVQDNPLSLQQWMQHAYEECLDQAVYLRRAMQALAEQPAPMIRGDIRDGLVDDEPAQQQQEPVAIEYWLQDTMESGRWVTTDNMAKATAEKMLSGEYGDVYPQGRIVEPSPPAIEAAHGIKV